MEKQRINRREAIKFIGSGLGWLALASAGVISLDVNELTYEAQLQRNVPDLVKRYPFLKPYSVTPDEIDCPGIGKIPVAVRQPRAAKSGTVGMRVCDGAVPGVMFVNEHGVSVAYQAGQADEQLSETRQLLSRTTPQELLVPVTGKNELVVDNRPRREIMVAGDSWARWGGVEHSVAAMLQRMLAFGGYDTHVTDVSSSGVNIANHLALLERFKRQRRPEPDSVITTLHYTDYAFDTQLNSLPVQQQRDTLGTLIYQASPAFDPFTEAIRLDARRLESILPIIGRLRQQYRERKGGDARISFNSEGIINDAGVLSPLNKDGKSYFERFLTIVQAFVKKQMDKAQVMMVLPDNLTDEAAELFEREIVGPVVETAQAASPSFRAFLNHNYPRDRYDAFDHPTPAGSFWLAQRVFSTLTGELPTASVNQQTWDHYRFVHNALAPFRGQLAGVAA